MAKVESIETYAQEIVADLNVVSIYKELMEASTSQGSVYLHAKETLVALYTDISMTSKDKATVIGQTISDIATGITGQAMQAAIAIAKENREGAYTLTKVKMDTLLVQEQIDKLAADNLQVVAQTENIVEDKKNSIYTGWKMQAELYRDYGVSTYNLATSTEIVSLANYLDYGLKKETINQVSKTSLDIEKGSKLKTTGLWKDQAELKRDYGVDTSAMNLDTTTIIPTLAYSNTGIKYETANQIANNALVLEKEIKVKTSDFWKSQAELKRDYGVTTSSLLLSTDIVPELNYTTDGIKYATEQQITNNAEILLKEGKLKTTALWKDQAELLRDHGVHTHDIALTTDMVPALAYSEYGIKHETIRKAKADIYNTYASSYRTNGTVVPDIYADGHLTSATEASNTGLTYWQTKVAERQEIGFDDNTRQHVANSSAAMISMLLAQNNNFATASAPGAFASWDTAVNYLNRTGHTWVRFATDAFGANMSNSPIGMTYVGVASNKTSATESNIAADYTWVLI